MKKQIVCTLFRGQICQSYDLLFEGLSCSRQCVAREKAFFAIYWAFFSAFRDQPTLIFPRQEQELGTAWQRLAQRAFEKSHFPRELYHSVHLTSQPHSLIHKQSCNLCLSPFLPQEWKDKRFLLLKAAVRRACWWEAAIFVCTVHCLSAKSTSY